ncbi:MAG: c-type cytochrome [Bacteriovorax sp.]|nr:c-type cytochrome [Bacteriovorax sp.]
MRFMYFVFLLSFVFVSAVNADSGSGIGPVKFVKLDATINQKMVELGKTTFKTKCSQCHKIEKRYTGPQLLAVTKRRKPEWIMNMILNPLEMTKQDPTAKALQSKLLVQMANQNVGEINARAILEFFRNNDKALTEKEIQAVPDLSK